MRYDGDIGEQWNGMEGRRRRGVKGVGWGGERKKRGENNAITSHEESRSRSK